MKKQAVLSLSGGMDSSTVLLNLLSNDYEVVALSFDYGQKHKKELKKTNNRDVKWPKRQESANIKTKNNIGRVNPTFLTYSFDEA